jgi:hypothetical protein
VGAGDRLVTANGAGSVPGDGSDGLGKRRSSCLDRVSISGSAVLQHSLPGKSLGEMLAGGAAAS